MLAPKKALFLVVPVVVVAVFASFLVAGKKSGEVDMIPDPPPERALRIATDKDPGRTSSKDTKPGANAAPDGTGKDSGDGTSTGDGSSSLSVEPAALGPDNPVGNPTDAPPYNDGTSMIANAKTATVRIQAAPPEGVENDPLPLPESRGALLPNERLDIQGRSLVDGGWEIANPEPRGGIAAFWVVQQAKGWVRVMVPVRPNNQTGWISTDQVDLVETKARINIDTGSRTLVAYNQAGDPIVNASVGVGAPNSPTPAGWFSVTDFGNPGGVYGPAAVGTGGLSEALDRFDGGAPQIAMHGWNGKPSFGLARSNGCVRIPNSEIVKIAMLPAGTPVVIT